jgi:hypothetical protein
MPSSIGNYRDSFVIGTNAYINVPVTGFGLDVVNAPYLAVSENGKSVRQIKAMPDDDIRLTLTNEGKIVANGLSVTASSDIQSSLTNGCDSSLGSAATCTIEYHPAAGATATTGTTGTTGTIYVTSTSSNSNQIALPVTLGWQKVNGGLPSDSSIYSLSIIHNQNGAAILYALINYNISQWGAYESTDGEHWEYVNSTPPYGRFMVENNNVLYLGTDSGHVYRSLDNGEHWNKVENGLPAPISTAANLVMYGDALYVSTYAGVYKSTDKGDNWSSFGLQSNSVMGLYASENTLYAGTAQNGLFTLTDPSKIWSSSDLAAHNLNTFTTIGSTVFVGTFFGDVFKSDNEGLNWQSQASLDGVNLVLGAWDNALFAGTSNGVFRSTDDGKHWTEFSAGIPSGGQVYHFVGLGSVLYAGTSKGLYRW